MSFIATTAPESAAGEVQEMYQRQQASWGYVPNYARVFSHRPAVMGRWAALLSGIRRHVEPRRFELVTLAAALALRNSYCALAHGKALTEHLPADVVVAVAEGREAEVLPPAEAAMVRLARQVAGNASGVAQADVDVLREHGLGDDEIFDVVATAAARAFFTKVLDGLGARPDAAYLDLEAPLREALTVGRPIGDGGARR